MRNVNRSFTNELRRQQIFHYFWNQNLDSIFSDIVKLNYVPTETMGYYGKEYEIALDACHKDPLLNDLRALLVINLTSTTDWFSFEKATQVDDSNGDIFAINIFVKVTDIDHRQVATYKKCLWSKEPAEICGDPRYVKLLISDEV